MGPPGMRNRQKTTPSSFYLPQPSLVSKNRGSFPTSARPLAVCAAPTQDLSIFTCLDNSDNSNFLIAVELCASLETLPDLSLGILPFAAALEDTPIN